MSKQTGITKGTAQPFRYCVANGKRYNNHVYRRASMYGSVRMKMCVRCSHIPNSNSYMTLVR